MARLHEYQAKQRLRAHGIQTPRGDVASSPEEAERIAGEIGAPVVVKIQAWTTGRKAMGGVVFVDTPAEARAAAKTLLAMKVGAFPVTQVLVEERVAIRGELFVSLMIDDAARAPVMLVAPGGGTGIEERADSVHQLACAIAEGPRQGDVLAALGGMGVDDETTLRLGDAVGKIYETARACEARSLEVNPLVVLDDGRVVAADCRMTVDDYAVFRHPELGIEIAREMDHPPTALEKVAYDVEQADHRGTFYFAKLNTEAEAGTKGLIGFHGAGGGGSMMSMDAITNAGYTIANFTDTSGNPSASKVYRAARIILTQPGLVGYFGSGSGVASQEQFWSAYGLAKAFWEVGLEIPAVIRLGGNSEDRAVHILEKACAELPAAVEGYKKDDTPQMIAERFDALVQAAGGKTHDVRSRRVPAFVGKADAYSFPITGGTVWIDAARWGEIGSVVVEHSHGLLKDVGGRPALAVAQEEIAGKDSELIACEVECRMAGADIVFVDLDIPGLEGVVA